MAEPTFYTLESLYEGFSERLSFTVTSTMMSLFAELSGDINPLHTDADFATAKGYSGAVVYGGLLIAKLSCMIGMHLPGRDAIWNSLSINFNRPLMIGQQVELEAQVEHISAATSTVQMKFKFTSEGQMIAKGTVGVLLKQVQASAE